MPVLPALKPLFEAITSPSQPMADLPPQVAREHIHAAMQASILGFYAAQPALPSEIDRQVPVDGGAIRIRKYAPKADGDLLPCHVYFHGGSFWLGTLEHFDPLCRGLAAEAECAVVSVEYRLAPEHKFPAAPEDCYAALLWIVEHAAELGVDPARLSVGGLSAGGALAAAVTLMARDRGGPALVMQVLEAPITDLTRGEPLTTPDGVVVPTDKAATVAYYLSDPADAAQPLASPLMAGDLHGLPPALVMCAEYDPLRAEGEAYARRLADAGVPVTYRCWEGQFHGSQQLAALIPQEAAAYQSQIASALRAAYGSPALAGGAA